MSPTDRIALVIGANGRFGAHAVCALLAHGWTIRALARDPASAARRAGPHMPIDWIAGDAMNAADVVAAAQGAQVIVHAANPPAYRNWRGLALPMMAASIAAARASSARLVLAGNVYNYGPDAGLAIAEDAPQAPTTRKGAVRVEMEAMLRQAAAQGVRSVVLRAGDFFGPAAPDSALGWLTVRRRRRVVRVFDTGPSHAFAYLPDLAKTLARLLDREAELEPVASFHFAGHQLAAGELARAVGRVTGQPQLKASAFPWPLVWGAAPFVGFMREMLEMRYLYHRPIGLDGTRLAAFLGEVPLTPLDLALRHSLIDLEIDVVPPARQAEITWTREARRPYIAAHAGPNAV